MIQETWLGETNFDFRFNKTTGTYPSATAIEIDGNDHYISDSIVFRCDFDVFWSLEKHTYGKATILLCAFIVSHEHSF